MRKQCLKSQTQLSEYSRQEGAAVVLIEHDISRARSIADRLVVMDDGRLNPFLSETKTLEVKL